MGVSIAGFIRQTALYHAAGEKNRYGESTYATPVQVACRAEIRTAMVRNAAGNLVLSRSRLFLLPGQVVQENDRFTVDNKLATVVAVDQGYGRQLHHKVAYLG